MGLMALQEDTPWGHHSHQDLDCLLLPTKPLPHQHALKAAWVTEGFLRPLPCTPPSGPRPTAARESPPGVYSHASGPSPLGDREATWSMSHISPSTANTLTRSLCEVSLCHRSTTKRMTSPVEGAVVRCHPAALDLPCQVPEDGKPEQSLQPGSLD